MKSVSDLIEKANTLMEDNRYNEAEPLLLVAIKHNVKNPEAYYLLGEVYCKQQRFKESIDILRHADTLLPNHPEILHLLGWALFMSGNIVDGRSFMTITLKSNPNDIRLLCDLTVLEMQAQDYLKAREYARTAMNLAPNDEMVQEVNTVLDHMYQLKKSLPNKH